MLHLHAEETTASRRVVQQVLAVARADEGGDAGQRGIVLLIRLADGKRRKLHQVLQLRHRTGSQAVELIQVDKSHHAQLSLEAPVGREVHLVGVIGLQRLRHEALAEGGFQPPLLLTHQQRCHTISKGRVLSHPLRHHRQHPSAEMLHPIRLLRDTLRQVRQTVHPIPCRKFLNIKGKGMIVLHQSGMDIARHIPVPTRNACRLDFQAKRIQFPLAQEFEGRPLLSFRTELVDLREHVVTELVTVVQIAFHPFRRIALHFLHFLRFLSVHHFRFSYQPMPYIQAKFFPILHSHIVFFFRQI